MGDVSNEYIKKQVQTMCFFFPNPSLYALFIHMDAQFEGNMGFVRNALTGKYYRLTMHAGASRIAAYLPNPAEPGTPVVTNPLLQPSTTI